MIRDTMFESIQVLIMCVAVALFAAWVTALKKEIIGLREEVDRLRQVVNDQLSKIPPATQVREAGKTRTHSGHTHAVWGDKL